MTSAPLDENTSSANTAPPSNRKLASWLFSWGAARAILIGVAGLITVIALLWTEENWRGKRAWEQFKGDWEAKGERFDLASYLPKAVPPEQNFAATPFLTPLLDYEVVNNDVRWRDPEGVERILSVSARDAASAKGDWQRAEFCDLASAGERFRRDTNFTAGPKGQTPAQAVLFALEKYQAVWAELHQAKERPYAMLSNQLDASPVVALQQFSALKSLSQVALLRASALLELNRSAEALAEVELMFRLADSLQSKPLLISQMVRIAVLKSALQPIWEGIARKRWTETELIKLQERLSSVRLLKEYSVTMRGERAFGCELTAQMIAGHLPGGPQNSGRNFRSLMPRGLLYQNQVVSCRMFQEVILAAVDDDKHRVYPEKCRDDALAAVVGRHTPYNVFARMLFPAIRKSAQQCALAQTSIDLATVACALERYRLASGRHPETLAALTPRFMPAIPPDVMNGQSLSYRAEPDGTVTLYSVGWNRSDDGGNVAARKSGQVDPERGDWVWQY